MNQKKKQNPWKLLHIFENEARIEIINLLLKFEWRSLSDIARELEKKKWKMTLPGVLKHMKELESAGVIRSQSGAFTEQPDARKTIYILEGKERIEKIMNQLKDVGKLLQTGVIFSETAKLARKFQMMRRKPTEKEKEELKILIEKCESKQINEYLTEDEKKKIKLWKMMLALE